MVPGIPLTAIERPEPTSPLLLLNLNFFIHAIFIASDKTSLVRHPLSNSLPDLFLSDTQLSTLHYRISNYKLYHYFLSKSDVCAYRSTNTPAVRLMDFDSLNFDAIWLKISLPFEMLLLCFAYTLPPLPQFFLLCTTPRLPDILRKALLSLHPHA